PGIGITSAMRIVTARRMSTLRFEDLKKLGVVLKRAQYFITCSGKTRTGAKISQNSMLLSLLPEKMVTSEQLSLFDQSLLPLEGRLG
ncbi:MAG: hypothetical protein K0Q75_2827, partial [Anaerospora sp.]|nr:hypothetical protein [Anaerospora sp.]